MKYIIGFLFFLPGLVWAGKRNFKTCGTYEVTALVECPTDCQLVLYPESQSQEVILVSDPGVTDLKVYQGSFIQTKIQVHHLTAAGHPEVRLLDIPLRRISSESTRSLKKIKRGDCEP